MSTNSMIGFQSKNGKVKGIYLHSDGHIESAGAMLLQSYKSADKVKKLVALGSLSSLAPEIGVKHEFDLPRYWNFDTNAVTKEYEEYVAKYGDMVRAYHRERGDEWENCKPNEYANADKFWEDNGERWEFMYLFSAKTGKWECRKGTGIPREMTKEVVEQAKKEQAARIAALKERDSKHAATRS